MLPQKEEVIIVDITNILSNDERLVIESWVSSGGTGLFLVKAFKFWDLVKLSINSRVSLKKFRSLSKLDRFILWKV